MNIAGSIALRSKVLSGIKLHSKAPQYIFDGNNALYREDVQNILSLDRSMTNLGIHLLSWHTFKWVL